MPNNLLSGCNAFRLVTQPLHCPKYSLVIFPWNSKRVAVWNNIFYEYVVTIVTINIWLRFSCKRRFFLSEENGGN